MVQVMPSLPRRTVPLGEVVAAAFDEASRITSDPETAAKLATETVKDVLVGAGAVSTLRRLASWQPRKRRKARAIPRTQPWFVL